MSRFLFISRNALIHDLAWTVAREGHAARYAVLSRSEREVGDGFVEKVARWEDHRDWADVVVFDDVDFGSEAQALRKAGKAVVGGTPYTDRLELDRDLGLAEMKAAGLTTIPSWDFESFDAAIEFIRKAPDRYVVKPNGKAQNEKVLSFVGQEEDGRDVVTVLEHYRRGWAGKIHSFQVQKFVAGVEVAVGGFFNGRDFVGPAFVNFEHKRMFNDNIGPSTGEMGTLAFFLEDSRLFRETLARMKDRLAGAGYTGYFDINCIANARGIYPLEMTTRFGYPTINLQIEGVLSKWGDLLAALARGEAFPLRTKKGFLIAVVVAVPPFPFDDAAAFRKYSEDAVIIYKKPPIRPAADPAAAFGPEGVHPADVKVVDGDWRLTGTSGYALVVTGAGSTVDDARREAYNRVKNILIPNMFYRTDIGERWNREGDLLQTWGYLT